MTARGIKLSSFILKPDCNADFLILIHNSIIRNSYTCTGCDKIVPF